MGMKFLNKKGWHTGSFRNIERVWKAEQKNEEELKKLEELKKQIAEEREVAELRQLQEQAGLVPKQHRLDFLYDSGLSTGKATADEYLLGKPLEEAPTESELSKAAAAPGALFVGKGGGDGDKDEAKPASANEMWRKLHADPLLMIRQQEQAALAKIRSNPVRMMALKKEAEEQQRKKDEKRALKAEAKAKRREKKAARREKKRHKGGGKGGGGGGTEGGGGGGGRGSRSDDSDDGSSSEEEEDPHRARKEHREAGASRGGTTDAGRRVGRRGAGKEDGEGDGSGGRARERPREGGQGEGARLGGDGGRGGRGERSDLGSVSGKHRREEERPDGHWEERGHHWRGRHDSPDGNGDGDRNAGRLLGRAAGKGSPTRRQGGAEFRVPKDRPRDGGLDRRDGGGGFRVPQERPRDKGLDRMDGGRDGRDRDSDRDRDRDTDRDKDRSFVERARRSPEGARRGQPSGSRDSRDAINGGDRGEGGRGHVGGDNGAGGRLHSWGHGYSWEEAEDDRRRGGAPRSIERHQGEPRGASARDGGQAAGRTRGRSRSPSPGAGPGPGPGPGSRREYERCDGGRPKRQVEQQQEKVEEGRRAGKRRHDSSSESGDEEEEQERSEKGLPPGGLRGATKKERSAGETPAAEAEAEMEAEAAPVAEEEQGEEKEKEVRRGPTDESGISYGLSYNSRMPAMKARAAPAAAADPVAPADGTAMPPPRRKHVAGRLSEEEKAKRLAEMQADAEVHEEDRWQRLKHAAAKDASEAARNERSATKKNFLEEANKAVYGAGKGGSLTVEESLRRRTHFSDRGRSEGNAFRR
eukprot:jgi/Mesen1/3590/ME000020S03124